MRSSFACVSSPCVPCPARFSSGVRACVAGDALGGDVKYTACALLAAPLPLPGLSGLGLRAHCFADAGNLIPWSAPPLQALADTRVAVGAGLGLSIGVARLELNYSVPVRARPEDVQERWQFGIAATAFG
jgi:outer membrane protein assembly factor BamA